MTGADQERSGDKLNLSANRRSSSPLHRSDDDIVSAIARQVRALGRRLAEADPDTAHLLRRLDTELTLAWAQAVAGWRAAGFSDGAIAEVLGVTKQAVQQRWPRASEAGA